MNELSLTVDLIEEQIVRGSLRWLANFSEIRRDFYIEDLKISLYATGGLEEKGFLLSRLFSSLVTPKYKVHLLACAFPELDEKYLRKLITASKRKFGEDDWIFLVLIQEKPIERTVRKIIEDFGEQRIGVAIYSSSSREEVASDNVLGKGLKRQLKLTEPRFEAFDLPDYVKSFAIVFTLITVILLTLHLFFMVPVFAFSIIPVTLGIMFLLSLIGGHLLYKSQYRVTLLMTTKGFELRKGNSKIEKSWADFNDLALHISSKRETYVRLYGEKETFDLPLSRTGISRKETYNTIRQSIRRKKNGSPD
jgi:hypothetical protein